MTSRSVVSILLSLFVCSAAGAQDQPPASPPQDADHAAVRRALGEGPAIATAEPSPDVPAGTIRVMVVSETNLPVAGAVVELGIMGQEGQRQKLQARTGNDGTCAYSGRPTGVGQSYRVNVPHEGAVYSSTPFQLPPDRGYAVRIMRIQTTRDGRVLLQALGRTLVQFQDERLHVTQQAQLINMGERTYVFPAEGQLVRLSDGFTAFQSQDVMTDQRVVAADEGFRIHGSIPPGQATLTWAFDLPIHGSQARFRVPVPFRTYTYHFIADAPPGVRLDLSGVPPAELHDTGEQRVLISQVQRRPTDPPLESIGVTISDIPGPGPLRWIAVGGLLVLLAAAGLLSVRGGDPARAAAAASEQRKQQLLDEASEIERLHRAGEVGPRYHARRMEEIVDALAAVLAQESARATQSKGTPADTKRSARG